MTMVSCHLSRVEHVQRSSTIIVFTNGSKRAAKQNVLVVRVHFCNFNFIIMYKFIIGMALVTAGVLYLNNKPKNALDYQFESFKDKYNIKYSSK